MSSDAVQVFRRHVSALAARDLDAVVATYAADAILVDGNRIGRGHEHIRAVFADVLDAAADLEPDSTVLDADDVVFVSYRARRPGLPDLVGTDTFVCRDDAIVVHTGFNIGIDGTGRLGTAREAQ